LSNNPKKIGTILLAETVRQELFFSLLRQSFRLFV
jgi:hypothetical protein